MTTTNLPSSIIVESQHQGVGENREDALAATALLSSGPAGSAACRFLLA